ncbi:peptide chain release factor N(5)-glutamine methyltransferase [Spongiibacter sp. KMU-158]|uniref:Release factor glutamine methyltransferase n=2 Tax=Spongiibacter pelagi TaxID=2760804 RepID=A0A927GWT9_9GAMM|nr:peptide chain release factor N(5)-glutamine methyltransferase [Spongiibacter pelagi]
MAWRSRLSESDSPDLDVALLLCHCLQKPRSYLYSWPEKRLSDEQFAEFAALFTRRERGEPIAHILGEREFWSLPLDVNNSTLIPRPDTECLVEQALKLIPAVPGAILDLGTGTGAIALALASELPAWSVLGVDLQAEAVALAAGNAKKLGLQNLRFEQSNWFDNISRQTFDLIVSNPPYIAQDDPHLEQGDVRFEPHSALVAADNGLADLAQIINAAPSFLKPGAALLLEHGYQQAEPVAKLLQNRGFVEIACFDDYAGNPRVSKGVWQPGSGVKEQ